MLKKTLFYAMVLFSIKLQASTEQELLTSEPYYAEYRKILSDTYKGIDVGIIPDEERTEISLTHGSSPVYGEILFDSVSFIINYLKMSPDDVFYDLGSGLGKFVYQVYLMSPCKKAVGIELSETRYKKAKSIEKKAAQVYKDCFKFENQMRKLFEKPQLEKVSGKSIKYINGNILEEDISDATVIYMDVFLNTDEFKRDLNAKLLELKDGLRIFSLHQLLPHKYLHKVKTFSIPQSWAADTPVYFYILDRENKHPNLDGEEQEQEAPALESEPQESKEQEEEETPEEE